MNKVLQFNFRDFTSYKEIECIIDGEPQKLSFSSPEFLAFKTAIKEHLEIDKWLINIEASRFNDKEKLTLIDFFDERIMTKGLIGALKFKNICVTWNQQLIYDVHINIMSRFDHENPYFLLYMLSFESPNLLDGLDINAKEDELYEHLLVLIFKIQLKKAFKNGIYKTYVELKKNDERFKGKLDIARHITENPIFNGKFAYSTKEYSYDNPLNHLILHAYERLKSSYYSLVQANIDQDPELRKALNIIRNNVRSFDRTAVHGTIAKNLMPLKNAYYMDYENLRQTSLNVLRNLKISMFNGDLDDDVQGILFYVPTLWEKFLYEQFSKKMNTEELRFEAQSEMKIVSSQENLRYRLTVIPDFLFYSKNNKPIFIMDAKFSPYWYNLATGKRILNVKDSIYRLLTYMTAYKLEAIGVIFPTNEEPLQNRRLQISEYNTSQTIYCFEVVVPAGDLAYTEWVRIFQVNVLQTIEYVESNVQQINAAAK